MQNINVNIVPDNFPQTIRYSQGDIGRQFKINVTDFEIPNGATVKVQATKPSGFGFSVAGVVAGSSVTFTTTAEMTDEAGRFQAKLQITSGDDVIGTANFLMIGERNPHPEGTTDGSQGTIIPELTLLVERVEAAASSVLDMEVVANTLPAGSQATYSYDEDLNKATFGIPEGQAGAGAAGVVASAYSAAKTYKVGDYVLYNSNLYRCTTAITTAEAWTAAHWTQVVLADDVTDLKTDLEDTQTGVTDLANLNPLALFVNWEQGGINNAGQDISVYARIKSKGYIKTYIGSTFTFNVANGYKYYLVYYTTDGVWKRTEDTFRTEPYTFTPYENQNIRIVVAKSNDAENILPNEGENLTISVTEPIVTEIARLKEGGYYSLDFATINGGYIDNATGEAISYNNWKYTDYIDVTDSQNGKIVIKNIQGNGQETLDGNVYNAWYDAGKNFIKGLSINNGEIAIPPNAVYMRLSTRSIFSQYVGIYRSGLFENSNKYLKFMTWNVGIFNDGTTRPTTEEAPTQIAKLLKTIGREDADILNTQEFATYVDSGAEYPSYKLLDFKYDYKGGGNSTGEFSFSKLPIKNIQQITFASGSNRPCWMFDIEYEGKTITIINAHLSIELDPSVHRNADTSELISIMNTKEYVILTGDFNASSQSEFDAYKTAGYTICNGGDFGWFDTWPIGFESTWPCKSLDNIIVSKNIIPQYVEAVESPISDHAPLYAELKII